ncbi:MAG TPA: tripartite tricarboxylate transporter permease, partial [Deinococcales bacterium]|nr:tripartite tricarboxylate transporter permease [Deinococcales bacterium]
MTEVLGLLAGGFATALQPFNLLVAFIGVFVGTTIGMLPGIGPINAIAILIPISFALGLEPTAMLILFAGIYYGSQYGNSISTILLNVPGTSSAVATAIDGYPLARKGRGGQALAISAIASFVGGTLSVIGLMFFAPVLAQWAIRFGPAEYFILMIFTFTTLSALTGRHFVKGLIATGLGLAMAMVGADASNVARFTFGQMRLLDGFDFVVVTIGLFAVSEVFTLLEQTRMGENTIMKVDRVMITFREFLDSLWVMIRSSISGFLVGVLPGAGATIASFLAYTTEQRLVDKEGTFGEGDLRGVAAPEAANNSAVSGAFIPLLTLGVPGSGT